MIKSILLVLVFLSALAYGGGCGISGSSPSFSAFSCEPHEGEKSTIVGIDFTTGAVFCKYGKISAETKKNYTQTNCAEEYMKVKQDSLNGNLTKDIKKYVNRLGTFGLKMKNDSAVKEILSNKALTEKLAEIVKKSKNKDNTWKSQFEKMFQGSAIDSHSKYEKTIAAIIAGVFTLDPKYFKPGYLNEMGEIELKDEYKTSNVSDETGITMGAIGLLFDKAFSYEWKITDPIDMFDKQVLGYLLQISDAFRKIFGEMIMVIYLMVGIFSSGYYSYMKFMEKKGKDGLNINNVSFVMTAMLSFAFFTAPVSDDGKMNGSPQSINQANTDGSSQPSILDGSGYSSLAQEGLRLAVGIGTYYGNLAADKLLYYHLKLISYKMGVIDFNQKSEDHINKEVKELEARKARMSSMLHFYDNVCSPYYSKGENGYFRKDEEGQKSQTLSGKDYKGILAKNGISADRLSYQACSGLETEIGDSVKQYATTAVSLSQRLDGLTVLHNTSSKSYNGVSALAQLMIYSQNYMGWFLSPSIPVSYFFFRNSEVFLYDKAEITKNKKEIITGAITNKAKSIKADKDIDTAYMEDMATAIMTSGPVKSGFWFMVPGFDGVFNMFNNMLGKLYISDVDTYNAIRGLKDSPSVIGKMTNKLMGSKLLKPIKSFSSSVASFTLGKIPFIGKIVDFFTGNKKSNLIKGVLTILAFFVAVAVIQMAIVSATTMIITAYLAIKVLLYLIELLFFYLAIPIIGISSAILSKSGGKNPLAGYTTHIVSVMTGPILIVFITSVIVPITMLFNSLFGVLVKLTIVVLDYGETMLRHGNSHADTAQGSTSFEFGASIQKTMTIASMEGASMVLSSLITLLISLYIIYTYKGWMMKLGGLAQDTDTFKELTSDIKGSAAGKVINPLS